MLDEICPVQFIEGVNENGEIKRGIGGSIQGYSQIGHLRNIALGFTPSHTFLLNKIEIYLFWQEFTEPVEYEAKLYSNFKNSPASMVLREGRLSFNKTISGLGWCNIELNQPIVVFAKNNYWLGLESWNARFFLLRAKEGKTVPFNEGEPKELYGSAIIEWLSDSSWEHKFMLRFYGRVLPVVS